MKIRHIAAALTMALTSVAAHAVTSTRYITVNSTFNNGPVRSVTQRFTMTFDLEEGGSFVAPVEGYSTTSTFESFNPSNINLSFFRAENLWAFNIDGNGSGIYFFAIYFTVLEDGSLSPVGAKYNQYSYIDYPYGEPTLAITTGDIDVTITDSVPEPATWAMMIGGFGAIGATMRRRKRATA
jgi:hypothetical protein